MAKPRNAAGYETGHLARVRATCLYVATTQAVAGVLRSMMSEPEAKEALAFLREDFDSVETLGPRRAAEFLYGTLDDDAQADAWVAARDLLDGLS